VKRPDADIPYKADNKLIINYHTSNEFVGENKLHVLPFSAPNQNRSSGGYLKKFINPDDTFHLGSLNDWILNKECRITYYIEHSHIRYAIELHTALIAKV
jgi:hypothetical protein